MGIMHEGIWDTLLEHWNGLDGWNSFWQGARDGMNLVGIMGVILINDGILAYDWRLAY